MMQSEKIKNQLAGFWSWWIEELTGCIPARLKRRFDKLPQADIHSDRTKVRITKIENAEGRTLLETRPLEEFDDAAWNELSGLILDSRSRLFLDRRDFHEVRLTLPAAAATNLRGSINLQLMLVSPVDPTLLEWTYSVEERTREHLTALVILVRKSHIDCLASQFTNRGLDMPPLWCTGSAGPIKIRGGKSVHRSPHRARMKQGTLYAALLLGSVPITTLVAAKILIMTNESRLAELRVANMPRISGMSAARREEAVRDVAAPLAKMPMISAILNDLALALPTTSYMQEFSIDANQAIAFSIAGRADEAAANMVVKQTRLISVSPEVSAGSGDNELLNFTASLQ